MPKIPLVLTQPRSDHISIKIQPEDKKGAKIWNPLENKTQRILKHDQAVILLNNIIIPSYSQESLSTPWTRELAQSC